VQGGKLRVVALFQSQLRGVRTGAVLDARVQRGAAHGGVGAVHEGVSGGGRAATPLRRCCRRPLRCASHPHRGSEYIHTQIYI